MRKSASQILTEDSRRFSSTDRYDVFLSHSYQDAELIHSIKAIIESLGLKAYVDWIEDAGLDRTRVTTQTARVLRDRMKTCSCLVYVHSSNATESVWMPWELGYFDGLRPRHVWILPLVSEHDSESKGQEYLGLYPPLEKLTALRGRLSLGFSKIGNEHEDIPLAKAASGPGVYYAGAQ
jgi:TIR domain